jgi:hypothetical protein
MKSKIFIFVTVLLILAGCGGGNKLVGSWQPAEGDEVGTLTFNANDTFEMDMEMMGKKMRMSGDYKLEEEKLTMTMQDVKVEGATEKEQADLKQMMQMNKTNTATVKFTSDTEMELTSQGSTTKFKKK